MSDQKRVTAFKIDAKAQLIIPVTISCLTEMQECVGGYIERAGTLPNGDDVYVDEEGLLKLGQKGIFEGFTFKDAFQDWYAGNGLIIGADPLTGENQDAESTLAQLSEWVTFRSLVKL